MIALTLLFLVPAALAQYGNPGSSSSSASSAPSSTTVAAPAASQSGVHDVDVGSGGSLTYNPNTLTAAVGDKVNFHFFPLNHSVVQSTFSEPCTPTQPQGIFSGFMPVSSGEGVGVHALSIPHG
jgi:plastocyanin